MLWGATLCVARLGLLQAGKWTAAAVQWAVDLLAAPEMLATIACRIACTPQGPWCVYAVLGDLYNIYVSAIPSLHQHAFAREPCPRYSGLFDCALAGLLITAVAAAALPLQPVSVLAWPCRIAWLNV